MSLASGTGGGGGCEEVDIMLHTGHRRIDWVALMNGHVEAPVKLEVSDSSVRRELQLPINPDFVCVFA